MEALKHCYYKDKDFNIDLIITFNKKDIENIYHILDEYFYIDEINFIKKEIDSALSDFDLSFDFLKDKIIESR